MPLPHDSCPVSTPGKPSLQITEAKETKGHAEFNAVAGGGAGGYIDRDQLADLIKSLKLTVRPVPSFPKRLHTIVTD